MALTLMMVLTSDAVLKGENDVGSITGSLAEPCLEEVKDLVGIPSAESEEVHQGAGDSGPVAIGISKK